MYKNIVQRIKDSDYRYNKAKQFTSVNFRDNGDFF